MKSERRGRRQAETEIVKLQQRSQITSSHTPTRARTHESHTTAIFSILHNNSYTQGKVLLCFEDMFTVTMEPEDHPQVISRNFCARGNQVCVTIICCIRRYVKLLNSQGLINPQRRVELCMIIAFILQDTTLQTKGRTELRVCAPVFTCEMIQQPYSIIIATHLPLIYYGNKPFLAFCMDLYSVGGLTLYS